VAWCTFTDPELAHVGLTEEEARKIHGERITVCRYPCGSTDRGRTDGTEFVIAKFIPGPGGRLLGAHIHSCPTCTDVVRQPAKLYSIARLKANPFLRILAQVPRTNTDLN